MKKCKIEVLKTTFHDDLAQQYGCKNLGKCPMHKVGDIFYGDYAKPEGLCDEAWKAMYQYVFALSHGSNIFYYGDWIDKEGVAICSCNDGIRPVIFKIERTDEEFFIRKAIGWVLREYSKTNKEWVSEFVANNRLSKLSEKEASKYL